MGERKGHLVCLDIAVNELVFSIRVIMRHRGCSQLPAAQRARGMAGHPGTLVEVVGVALGAMLCPAAPPGSLCSLC